MRSRSFGLLCRNALRNGHRVTEKPNDRVGQLRGGSAQIDCQRVFAGVRFFQGVDLASQQLRGHEMPMASSQMLGDQVSTAAQIDQPYLRTVADDDLTMGSIDPYQVFRIFHEIRFFEWETSQRADIAYMVDQSHNLKGKIEAMIQTVTIAQQLFAKASLVDAKKLAAAQKKCNLVEAESVLQDAFATDVRPAMQEWRDSKGLPKDPMEAFRQSGYLERITKERAAKNAHNVSSYA